jgi:hypothetical protein
MKRLIALLFPAIFLGGCVTVPYDTDSVYYQTYPATVSAQVSSGYYYPDRTYPYTPAPYSRPYPYYPYYQPPRYVPPAPVIVPPPIEFNYNRNVRPGWQNHPHPHHDEFRNGPRPEWNHPGAARPQWQQRNDGHPEWQRREWQRREWQRGGDGNERRGDGREQWRHDGSRGNFRQR